MIDVRESVAYAATLGHVDLSAVQEALASLGVECGEDRSGSSERLIELARSRNETPKTVFLLFDEMSEQVVSEIRLIKRSFDCSLALVGPATNAQSILTAIRAGADDFLDSNRPLHPELDALMVRLSQRLASDTTEGRTIGVVSASGGCGVSVLACNLAAELAKSGKAGLLDLHPCGGDQASLLQLSPRYNFLDLASHAETLDDTMFRQSMESHESGIELLASPATVSEIHPIGLQTIQQIIRLARASYQHVVIDLEDLVHGDQMQAISRCDDIVVVFRPDVTSLRRTRRSLAQLLDAGIDAEQLKLVANRRGRASLSISKAESALGLEIAATIPEDARAVVASVNLGIPVVAESPRSKASVAIRRLAGELGAQREVATPPSGKAAVSLATAASLSLFRLFAA